MQIRRAYSQKNVLEDQLYDIIINKLGTSLQTVGYRQMTMIACIKYNISVSKEDVRKAVKIEWILLSCLLLAKEETTSFDENFVTIRD